MINEHFVAGAKFNSRRDFAEDERGIIGFAHALFAVTRELAKYS